MPKKTVKAGTSKSAAEERKSLFVDAYIANGGNATEAAIKAGYSAKSACAQASRLLSDAKIAGLVAERAKKVAKKYELTKELVIKTIVQELNFDPARLYDESGRLKQLNELDEDVRMALTSVEFEQVGSLDAPIFVRKVKWAQKQGAREQAMKHLGLFEEDNKQKNPVQELDDAALDRLIAKKSAEISKLH